METHTPIDEHPGGPVLAHHGKNVLLSTDATDMASFCLRVTLGLVMFPHGMQKLFGWFGGAGLQNTIGYYITNYGVLPMITLLVIVAEAAGSIALIIGFWSRLVAAGIGLIMIGAIFSVHFQHGFFMNWTGQQAGEGFEFHLLVIGMCIALIIRGSGKWSVDSYLDHRLNP
ncbi:DoxX family protein [Rhodocytophaga aerolata]|uniref:DoxX family protein n=1 Tax=Rhodocytophaga aerolata TaxID=455078 RepID=A0ABT8R040_9BACT|nr:DoxX family protein [Rhodocytophaga aerolata]MDO1445461.1 DoxX family protein [Rhodocytophaga aerolata]